MDSGERSPARLLGWVVLAGLVVRLALWGYFTTHVSTLVEYRLPDDALYYFTTAQSVAHGNGITHDGVHPTNGMHPLWLLVISPVFALGLSKWAAIHAALLLQSLVDTVTVWLVGRVVYGALPKAEESNRTRAAIAAALIYALSPIVIVQSINGLETSLAAVLLVAWAGVMRKWTCSTSGAPVAGVIPGVITGSLFLARTDTIILVLPALLWIAYKKRKHLGEVAIAALCALLVVSPWLWWNIHTFGTIVQSSAQAVPFFAAKKYEVIYGTPGKYWVLLLEALRNIFKPFVFSTLGLGAATILYAFRHRQEALSAGRQVIYLMVAGAMLLLAIHSIVRGFVREWYIEQLIALFLVAYGVSIGYAERQAARLSGRLTLAVVIVVLQLFWIKPHFVSQTDVLDRGVPLVERLTRDHKVAALNSGFYSYFSSRDGAVVNIDGVVNSDAVRHIKAGDLGQYLVQDSVDCVLEFKGDLSGYVGLIDHGLLRSFVLDSTIATRDSSSPILLYKRKQ